MASDLLQRVGDFIARWSGIPILVAVALIVLNFIVQLLPGAWPIVGWLARTNLFLHVALVVGFMGILLGDAL